LRSLEEALKLTVLLSCLKVTALRRPPLLEEMLGVIAVVGVGGVRQRAQRGSSRCSSGKLTGPKRKWPEAVIEDEPRECSNR